MYFTHPREVPTSARRLIRRRVLVTRSPCYLRGLAILSAVTFAGCPTSEPGAADSPSEPSLEDSSPGSSPAGGPETTREEGGSIRTELGFGIVLNEESSLQREWIAVHDNLPLVFEGTPGVTTSFQSGSRYSSGEYLYSAQATLTAQSSQPVTAFEVRFITFDVFGERMSTLSATEIEDIAPGGKKMFDWRWDLFRENDVSRYFASVAFIANVRTADGQVHRANYGSVLDVVRRFAEEATEADLDPSPDEP